MKLRATYRASIAAAAFFAVLAAVPGAQAFTFVDQDNGGARQGFTDFDKPSASDRQAPVSRFGNEGSQSTIKRGDTSLQFGAPRSFNQRYNSDNLFNPYARDGR